ncbi:MAG: hypothetical protein LBN29_11095 [Mediterranea sp.]|jgi:hypothetical protein|nr:hypothetical protein [Mediterranea sp.]
MDDELFKSELHAERLKAALHNLRKMEDMLPPEYYDEKLNRYLDELSKTLKRIERLKNKK